MYEFELVRADWWIPLSTGQFFSLTKTLFLFQTKKNPETLNQRGVMFGCQARQSNRPHNKH